MTNSERVAVSVPDQPSKSSQPSQQDKKNLGPLDVLNEATKYTIFGALVLYVLGFLIWHAFLAEYGVSSIQFMQVEYLSAALCYLLVVAFFGVPSAIMFWLIMSASKRYLDKKPVEGVGTTVSLTASLWILMIVMFHREIFPYVQKGSAGSIWSFFWGLLGTVALFILARLVQKIIVKKIKSPRLRQFIAELDINNWFLGTICVVTVFRNPSVSKEFLMLTIGFFPMAYIYFLSSEGKPALRAMVAIAVGIAVLLHARHFGANQFGKISRSWGGGKPETGYIKFSASRPDMAASLGLHPVENLDSLRGFYGPVAILLRSADEIVLVDHAKPSASPAITNSVSTRIITNSITMKLTNGVLTNAQSQPTGTATAVVTNLPTLNATEVHASSNPPQLTATQVKADAVDVLVYTKDEP